jgi:transcriptional regulator with XRE-family HTH domain
MTSEEFLDIRKKNNLTQKQMAELLNLSKQSIRNFEHGRSKIRKIVEIALLSKLPISAILQK